MLLILASVSLSAVFSDKGVFSKAESAGAKYNEAKAREVLETVLMTDGQMEKHTNPKYNQDEFLDELIKSEIEGADVKGDVAIIGKYAYELDRSVPKIGRYLGLSKDLVWPEVEATIQLADDKKNATITINTIERKNGINKIEIWLLGEKIKEYTYDPARTEVTEPYIATQNGIYTIKTYGELMSKTTAKVDGIVASVTFDPNGNNEWQKSHSTKVTIQETTDKIVKAKYIWLTSTTTPEDSQFIEEQTFKNGDTISKEGITGTYYLWTMIETQSGEREKWRSEGFNFDNEGPTINSLTSTALSSTSLKLSVTATDSQSGIVKYKVFVNDILEKEETVNNIKVIDLREFIIESEIYNNNCYIIVTDKVGNNTRKDINARTLGKSPIITEVELNSKTSSRITINTTAIDEDNDKLTYKLYLGEESNKLKLVDTSAETEQGIQVQLEEGYLTEYKTYYYRIDVTDGINTASSSVYSVKTMCSGSTLNCNSAKKCTTCSGNGTVTCNSDKKTFIYESGSYKCGRCNKTYTTNGYYKVTCSVCGGVQYAYYDCACGNRPSKSISKGPGRHTCTSCRRIRRNKMLTWI